MLIRPIEEAEQLTAIDLIWGTFLEFEAPDYTEEGVQEFKKFIDDEYLFERLEFFGAFEDDVLKGVIAARNGIEHIALFFVPAQFQRQGIGRAMWQHMLAKSTFDAITVNSSPFAVPIYKRLGFVEIAPQQETNGIIFTLMQYVK